MMKRRERGKRIKARPVLLTGRDLDVLALVGLCRYVSTEQLSRECFPSVDRAQKRLRQLLDGGFIRVTLLASTESNLVSLTPAGLALLAERQPEVGSRSHLAGAINLVSVEHHLLLVDARLYVAGLAVTEGGRLLRWEGGHGALAERLGFRDAGLMPDGLAEMEIGGQVMRLAVEADCGTEVGKQLADKLRRYREVLSSETVAEVWIVVSGGEERRRRIEDLARQVGIAEWTRVMTQEHVIARPVNKPGPRAAGADRSVAPNMVPDQVVDSLSYQ